MPVIVHSSPGRVTGVWGSAVLLLRNGKPVAVKIGDLINRGDTLLTSQDGIIELTEGDGIKRLAIPAETIPELIEALNKQDAQAVPAAAVVADDGAALTGAERVARWVESVAPGVTTRVAADISAALVVEPRLAPELLQPVRAGGNVVAAVEEGPAVSLRAVAPTTAGAAAALSVIEIPAIGEIRKADGSLLNVGTALSNDELAGLVYVPPDEYDGRSPVGAFVYAVDDSLTRVTRSVQIVVTAVNDAPTARSESGTGIEDNAASIDFSGSDVDGSVVGFTLLEPLLHGRLLHADGVTPIAAGQTISAAQAAALQFQPNANFNGEVQIAFRAVDDGGRVSAPARYDLRVTPVNDAPLARADSLAGVEDTRATYSAVQLLGNDTDVEADPLTIASVSSGTGGSAVLNPDGSVSFNPAPDFTGTARFSYVAGDGQALSAPVSVQVVVAPVNDAPIASPDSLAAVEDTALRIGATQLLANDRDVDGNPLRVASVSAASGGRVVLNADGSLTFTPDLNFNGAAGFSYTASDGVALSSAVSVAVNVAPVNDVPVGQPDTLSAVEDTPVTFSAPQLLGNDTDVEGATLRIASVTSGAGGAAVLNADGTVSFTPELNFNGPASLSYTLTDGAAISAAVAVAVGVQAVNDSPVAAPDALKAVEDTPVTISAAQLLGNDTDVDGNALRIASVAPGNGGSVLLNADGSVTFTPSLHFNGPANFSYVASDGVALSAAAGVVVNVAPVNDAPVALPETLAATEDTPVIYRAEQLLGNDQDVEGTALTIAAVTSGSGGSVVLNANGTVSFTPDANFNGNATFTYVASDGAIRSLPAAVTVVVAAVNDAPLARADTLAGVEDTGLTFSAAQLLGNDTDVEADPLTIASVSSGTGGSAVLNPDGSVSFNPAPNFNGTASFSYVASDGQALSAPVAVQVVVAPVNDAPVVLPDTLAGVEDTPVTFSAAQLLANDGDVDADALRIASVTSGAGGTVSLNADGSLTFTPAANFNGPAGFSYIATDGLAVSTAASVVVNVAPVNDAPIVAPDTLAAVEDTVVVYTAAQLLGNDEDVEGSALVVASVTSGLGGSAVLNSDGNVSFTPDANFNGNASFSYTASDGAAGSLPGSVTVIVAPVNDAPLAQADQLAGVEDAAATFSAALLLGNDIDVDGNALAIASVTSGTGGSAVLNPDGSVRFTPAADFHGTATFSYVASDGTASSAPASVQVVVAPVNDAPVAAPDALTAVEDTATTFTAAQLLVNDSDVDGDPLRIASVNSVTGGNVVLNADGSVSFTPAADFNGLAGFTYTASDGAALSAAASVVVNVAPVNDVPVGQPDALAATEDTPVVYTAAQLLGNDANVEGAALRIASVTAGSGGSAVLNADGTVSFTPTLNFNGPASFTYTLSDGEAVSAAVGVLVNVQAVNDAPVAAPDVLNAVEDTAITFTAAQLLANDTDVDGNALRIASVTSGPGGSTVLNADGTVTFTPALNFNGPASFSYSAGDGETVSSPAAVAVDVLAVNDLPHANADVASTTRNQALTIAPSVLLANNVDDDGAGTLRITGVQSISGGSVSLDVVGNAVFVPTDGIIGPASFSYTITDDAGATSTAIVDVTVAAPTSGPLLSAPGTLFSLVEGATLASGSARILQTDLEATLGFAPDFLDSFDPVAGPTSSHTGFVNVVTGGHTNQTVFLNAGGTIALDWTFFNGEDLLSEITQGYNDFLLLMVTDPAGSRQITQLTSAEQLGVNTNGLAADATGSVSFTATLPGEHQFTWVVTNGRDTTKDSIVSVAPVSHIIGGNRFGTPIPFEIAAQSIDPIAAASLLVSISGVPAGAAFSAGNDLGAGRWSFSAAQLAELAFLPPAGFAGTVALTVTASTVEPGTGLLQTIAQQTSVVIDATGNSVMGTQVANLLLGTPANDYMQAFDGGDVVFGAGGNDILHGDAGTDTLEGDAGNDTLYGGLGADTLRGGDGDDRLFGGIGNDAIAGGLGSNVFAWALADRGNTGAPANDIIVDFNVATRQLNGDVLDLRDLLAGEITAGTEAGNLEQFLDFDTTSSPGDTLIRISSSGAFVAGAYNAGAEDQRIALQGIDLRSLGVFGLDAAATDNDIIAQLLQRGKLIAGGP